MAQQIYNRLVGVVHQFDHLGFSEPKTILVHHFVKPLRNYNGMSHLVNQIGILVHQNAKVQKVNQTGWFTKPKIRTPTDYKSGRPLVDKAFLKIHLGLWWIKR